MALWGLVQLAAGWTVVKAGTVDAILYWLTAACLAWLAAQISPDRQGVERPLRYIVAAGAAICFIGLLHLYTSDGRVFWLFPSGYDSRIPGPFVSRNNYAAFVELILPAVLVFAMRSRRRSWAYLLIAAALVAATVASGSRAGTVLVIAEVVVVALLVRRRVAAIAILGGLVALFVVVVGYQYLWERSTHDSDPFLLRREFLASTMTMIRTRPLHGFGLGSWVSAYPQFAVIDVGKTANHAHNEWAQWAAEGGLPAFALMLAVLLWTVRASARSVWGIGVVSVMVHSLVDYPFMRLGLAAWIFVFLGMLAVHGPRRQSRRARQAGSRRVLAAAAIPALLFCAFYTARSGWADVLYRRGTLPDLQRAVRLEPGRAEYQLSLAQADSEHAVQYLARAVTVDPAASNASIQLAGEWEASGEAARAESVLLEASRHDRQFAPSWALANFYFRSGKPEKAWPWIRTATNVYHGDLRPVFELCFLLSDSAESVIEPMIAGRPAAERQFLSFLLDQKRFSAAQATALRIADRATAEDRNVLLDHVDVQLSAGHGAAAWEVWRRFCAALAVCDSAPAGLSNGDFRWPIINRGFDWLLVPVVGVDAAQVREGGPALSLSFSGKEPELCGLLVHFVSLRTGARCHMRFEYRTAGLPPRTGLYWSDGAEPAYFLDAAENWTAADWSFSSPGETGRLLLGYHRSPGTTRLEGGLLLRNVRLECAASPTRTAFSFP
jgi:O-antigen ligase